MKGRSPHILSEVYAPIGDRPLTLVINPNPDTTLPEMDFEVSESTGGDVSQLMKVFNRFGSACELGEYAGKVRQADGGLLADSGEATRAIPSAVEPAQI